MLIDLCIVLLLATILVRGLGTGFVRQFFLAVGFMSGLLVGAALQPYTMAFADTVLSRALVSLLVTFGLAFLVGRLGETVGTAIKARLNHSMPLNRIDAILGSCAGAITVLASVWLLTPIVSGLPSAGLQRALDNSFIISTLERRLPEAPEFISSIDKLVNPNGFPDVFAGLDREPLQPDAPLPSLGELQPAVQKARASIVKLEGRGCGGIVDGSGFVAADGLVITNAHVVAGVAQPTVVDTAGRHNATTTWFDPELDLAILRANNLAGKALDIKTQPVDNGTASVVLGYPGGGGFTASPATILDKLTARGHDIYDKGLTSRDIYEVKADIIPGNSGGPVLDKDGSVIGVVFAQSTTYDHIGYALTMPAVAQALQKVSHQTESLSTGACAE
jgi:S1-C subfamily serine protease